jgi:uncharacterized membrane protein
MYIGKKFLFLILCLSYFLSVNIGLQISLPDILSQLIYAIYVIIICFIILLLMSKIKFLQKIDREKNRKIVVVCTVLLIIVIFHLILRFTRGY